MSKTMDDIRAIFRNPKEYREAVGELVKDLIEEAHAPHVTNRERVGMMLVVEALQAGMAYAEMAQPSERLPGDKYACMAAIGGTWRMPPDDYRALVILNLSDRAIRECALDDVAAIYRDLTDAQVKVERQQSRIRFSSNAFIDVIDLSKLERVGRHLVGRRWNRIVVHDLAQPSAELRAILDARCDRLVVLADQQIGGAA